MLMNRGLSLTKHKAKVGHLILSFNYVTRHGGREDKDKGESNSIIFPWKVPFATFQF